MKPPLPRVALSAAFAGLLTATGAAIGDDDDDFVLRSQTVAQRVGGADGIAAFINAKVAPALLDSELAPFFTGGPMSPSAGGSARAEARRAHTAAHPAYPGQC